MEQETVSISAVDIQNEEGPKFGGVNISNQFDLYNNNFIFDVSMHD